ncbi:MAG: GTP cyclohydrolase II [Pseudomonadota bacterium]
MTHANALAPSLAERLARARTDMRSGVPVCLVEGARRALVLSAESVGAERLGALAGLGEPILAITGWRAETLKARAYDGDIARVKLPSGATPAWIRAVADPADDLESPMKGPFHTLRDGAADMARAGVLLAKSAHLLPAALVVELAPFVDIPGDITCLDLPGAAAALGANPVLARIVSGRVPLAPGRSQVQIFRPEDGGEEHYAVEIGAPDRSAPVLVRLHSACFTGDVLGSLKCDCGAQLDTALTMIGAEGAGVLLYLNQEGRGIGLANKMRAYALQDQGFDTVEANHRLGFEDDERDFRIGATILKSMGFASARLMTNNPAKVGMLEAHGVSVVERVPLKAGRGPLNEAYLDTKARKSGHIL